MRGGMNGDGRMSLLCSAFGLRSPRRRRAVSLIEVLFAVVVFAIGVYGLLDLATNSRRIHRKYSKRFRAGVLAQNRLATMRAAGYEALAAEAEATTPTLPLAAPAPLPGGDGFSWQVALSDDARIGAAMRIGVTVIWSAGDNSADASDADPKNRLTVVGIALGDAAKGGGR